MKTGRMGKRVGAGCSRIVTDELGEFRSVFRGMAEGDCRGAWKPVGSEALESELPEQRIRFLSESRVK